MAPNNDRGFFRITEKPHICTGEVLPDEVMRVINNRLRREESTRDVKFAIVYALEGNELKKYLLTARYAERIKVPAKDIETQKEFIREVDVDYTLTARTASGQVLLVEQDVDHRDDLGYFPITMKPSVSISESLPDGIMRAINKCLRWEEDSCGIKFVVVYALEGNQLRKYLLFPHYAEGMKVSAKDIENKNVVSLEVDVEYTLELRAASGERKECKKNPGEEELCCWPLK